MKTIICPYCKEENNPERILVDSELIGLSKRNPTFKMECKECGRIIYVTEIVKRCVEYEVRKEEE